VTIGFAASRMPSICRAGSAVKFSSISVDRQSVDFYGENAAAGATFGAAPAVDYGRAPWRAAACSAGFI
jgi:hypothetical protein